MAISRVSVQPIPRRTTHDTRQPASAWRWVPEEDAGGNITALDFAGEKLGDENVLFAAIAPFVGTGSFIEMAGEDGRIWRWWFHRGDVIVQVATISYPAVDIQD